MSKTILEFTPSQLMSHHLLPQGSDLQTILSRLISWKISVIFCNIANAHPPTKVQKTQLHASLFFC